MSVVKTSISHLDTIGKIIDIHIYDVEQDNILYICKDLLNSCFIVFKRYYEDSTCETIFKHIDEEVFNKIKDDQLDAYDLFIKKSKYNYIIVNAQIIDSIQTMSVSSRKTINKNILSGIVY